jgi:hypothetical protein
VFKEKGGRLPAQDVSPRLPQELQSTAAWPDEGNVKEFTTDDKLAREIFDEGAYVYFPSSRAEAPHWLNRESLPTVEFDLSPKIEKRLRKPIYVEQSVEKFHQWLLAVLLEARVDIAVVKSGEVMQFQLTGNLPLALASLPVLNLVNEILQRILGDHNSHIVWLGRQNNNRLGIVSGSELKVPSIEALSAGQSTLLGIFGTILRYGDHTKWQGGLPADEITGIRGRNRPDLSADGGRAT